MWQAHLEKSPDNKRYRLTISKNGRLLSFTDVIDGWRADGSFRTFYADTIEQISFTAVFWETPPLTLGTIDQPYECIIAQSGRLAFVQQDQRPFQSHFTDQQTVTFDNLGGDAQLVVPCPQQATTRYTHLASFLRSGSDEQKQAFFTAVGNAVSARLSDWPLWLNTSGLGVYWLHARLDSRPKYYTYQPYKNRHFYDTNG